jgi:hypothetical protein
MHLLRRLRERRAAKRADREAIAQARAENRRAGDEQPQSQTETVENAAGRFPAPP